MARALLAPDPPRAGKSLPFICAFIQQLFTTEPLACAGHGDATGNETH